MNTVVRVKPILAALMSTSLLFSATASTNSDNRNALPEIGKSAISTLALDKELQYGSAMMKSIRASQPIIHDPVLVEYINDLGNRLVKNAEDVHYKFNFFLINQSEINAFAFFGGNVGIHAGLLTAADNESELASVLAHEIAHVTQRHLARRLEAQTRNVPLTTAAIISGILVSLVNPQAGMAVLQTSMAASQQAGINYTRNNENEADRVGMDILVNSGFDANGAPNFFRKLASKYRYTSKPPAMLMTHPLPESRITDSRLRASRYPNKLLAPSLPFELAKSRLRSRYKGDPEQNIAIFEDEIRLSKYNIKEAAQYGLALSYFAAKKYDKALDLLLELRKSDAKNLFYVDALADVYIEQQAFDSAESMLQQLALIMPYNPVVTLNYANVLYHAKKFKQAETLLQDFLLIDSQHFIANDLLADVYLAQEKLAPHHIQRADVLALMGQYSKAIDQLHTAYNNTEKNSLMQKKIKAKILQFQEQDNQLKRL
ncbi:M48 family metalloprotease [Thalassotalea ponticola]|uniref:beta-barrel assembly-enhancing protease n=1 Tax=Thalassotalea ponticola TaxID=1523392 RepID=UPI0025B30E32|nr:M48 family metalloprotease [Thalassotalea ponticola]MDN3653028.1 M48 family metalloprotease [Thalassotalea ponticola]